MKSNLSILVLVGLFILLAACQPKSVPLDVRTTVPSTTPKASTLTPTASATLPATATPPPSSSPQRTPTPDLQPAICSPLAGYDRSRLEAAIFNPFDPPAAGLDDPHQGVDFADLEPINRYAREGLEVQAVLAGEVASIIDDRFPYGNALMIETPLSDLPAAWQEAFHLPAVQPPQPPHPALTCPDLPLPKWDLLTRSLYVLYAHMQQSPELAPGESVNCGQVIGTIGSSGNALNPHLHLEVRVGPSGARFESLAHYDASTKPEEMAYYCAWRVRGIFQLVDPNLLIDQMP